jgi:hypothetical protein
MKKVLVVNKFGKPLMPTTPRQARVLLESGRAKIYARRPFTFCLFLIPYFLLWRQVLLHKQLR